MTSTLLKDLETFEVKTSSSPEVIIKGSKGGSGPPLLLVHGYPQSRVIWHKVVPTLAKSYSLVIPDLRGYGQSSKPSSDDPKDHTLYAKSAMAADLAAVMAELGHDSYFVVAHDRGARVAHKLLVDHGAHVRKCLLLDIAPTLAMMERFDGQMATAYWHWAFLIQPTPFPEKAITASPELFAHQCLHGLPTGSRGGEVFTPAAYEEYMLGFRDPAATHGMCEDYRAAATHDLEEQRADIQSGRKIKVPIRVLWGQAGLVAKKFDNFKEWQSLCEEGLVDKRSRSVDSGHFIPEEIPDELLEDIHEFCV